MIGGTRLAVAALLTAAGAATAPPTAAPKPGVAAPKTAPATKAGASKPGAPTPKAGPSPTLEITEWRYRDGLEPSPTAATFDDSKWEVVKDPATGRGKGGVSFGWYRTTIQVPEKLGAVPVAEKPLQLAVLVDKYAEVWINGDFKFQFDPKQPPSAPKNRPLGYEIAGFNKANVIPLGVHKPGDTIPVAVLAINGPLGKPIGTYSIRYARLEFGRP